MFAAVAVFPLLYMISLSFQPTSDILAIAPDARSRRIRPTLNYVQAWSENSFGRYFLNSLIVALATVVITVCFASLAAFAFARYRFPFKEMHLLHLPREPGGAERRPDHPAVHPDGQAAPDRLAPGLVLIYSSENLPFSIFLLRGFFEAVPKELEESFRLDGASTLRVLTRLIAPLSLPALAVVAMFTFNFAWEEFVSR